jgi:hypothetical protein
VIRAAVQVGRQLVGNGMHVGHAHRVNVISRTT